MSARTSPTTSPPPPSSDAPSASISVGPEPRATRALATSSSAVISAVRQRVGRASASGQHRPDHAADAVCAHEQAVGAGARAELPPQQHEEHGQRSVDRAADGVGGDQPDGGRSSAQRLGSGHDVIEHSVDGLARACPDAAKAGPRPDRPYGNGRSDERHCVQEHRGRRRGNEQHHGAERRAGDDRCLADGSPPCVGALELRAGDEPRGAGGDAWAAPPRPTFVATAAITGTTTIGSPAAAAAASATMSAARTKSAPIINTRRSRRSAMTPPSGPKRTIGSTRAAVVSATHVPECVRSNTSASRATL